MKRAVRKQQLKPKKRRKSKFIRLDQLITIAGLLACLKITHMANLQRNYALFTYCIMLTLNFSTYKLIGYKFLLTHNY